MRYSASERAVNRGFEGGCAVACTGGSDGSGVLDVLDGVLGVLDGVLGELDGLLGVLDGVFGVLDGVFGELDGVLEASDGVLEASDEDEEERDESTSLTKRRCWLSKARFTSPADTITAKRGFGVLRSGKSAWLTERIAFASSVQS